MAHCLSQTAVYTPNLPTSRFSHLRQPPRNFSKFPTRAAAAEGRESLDHLQRQNKQLRAKKRAAPLGLLDRFPTARTVQEMIEAMDRMVEDPSYRASWQPPLPLTDAVTYGRGRTPWEIKERETEYKLRFDMPGMTKEDVKVWVEEKLLVVKAEKQPEKAAGDGDEDEEEWPANSYGKYSCRIALPEDVELEKIKAEVKDGVLYINIPKASSTAKVFDISVS